MDKDQFVNQKVNLKIFYLSQRSLCDAFLDFHNIAGLKPFVLASAYTPASPNQSPPHTTFPVFDPSSTANLISNPGNHQLKDLGNP